MIISIRNNDKFQYFLFKLSGNTILCTCFPRVLERCWLNAWWLKALEISLFGWYFAGRYSYYYYILVTRNGKKQKRAHDVTKNFCAWFETISTVMIRRNGVSHRVWNLIWLVYLHINVWGVHSMHRIRYIALS